MKADRANFDGTGAWTFEQRGPAVDITFDWRIRAEKPRFAGSPFF